MEVIHYLSFFAHESDINSIEKLLLKYDIEITTPEIIYNEVRYKIPFIYNDQNTLQLIEKETLIWKITTIYILDKELTFNIMKVIFTVVHCLL